MNLVLCDDELSWKNFLPLTFTRPVSEIRIGILTIRQKWDLALNTNCSYLTRNYLSNKFSFTSNPDSVFVASNCLPTDELVKAIQQLDKGDALYVGEKWIARRGEPNKQDAKSLVRKIEYKGQLFLIEQVWDIFKKNGQALQLDFEAITKGRSSKKISNTVTVIGNPQQVFLEDGAKAEACVLNTNDGPIYLGKESEIMEGSVVRGPFALCEHSALKLSTKVYGPSTVGPYSKVGGELNNSVVFGFSNKAHDGFLGNSVIGEWCNLGADTNNSNLKNNYGNVKLFNYHQNKAIDTGLQFCGLIMGDHSKCGINTMFNTGTVVGVGANIFGGGFPPTFIPSFSWGGSEGFEVYKLDKFFETASRVFERRGLAFSEAEQGIIKAVQQEIHD